MIVLKGNEQKLEVNSNQERLRAAEDFKWSPNVWYRLKARVERKPDGSLGQASVEVEFEPAADISVRIRPHTRRVPGLFGFSQDMVQTMRPPGWGLKELNELQE
jgi:hypothetical protein